MIKRKEYSESEKWLFLFIWERREFYLSFIWILFEFYLGKKRDLPGKEKRSPGVLPGKEKRLGWNLFEIYLIFVWILFEFYLKLIWEKREFYQGKKRDLRGKKEISPGPGVFRPEARKSMFFQFLPENIGLNLSMGEFFLKSWSMGRLFFSLFFSEFFASFFLDQRDNFHLRRRTTTTVPSPQSSANPSEP